MEKETELHSGWAQGKRRNNYTHLAACAHCKLPSFYSSTAPSHWVARSGLQHAAAEIPSTTLLERDIC